MVGKAYDERGTDWLELVIPPLPGTEAEDAEYTLRVHMNFLMSNWSCIFANGCPGMFGKQESHYNDDAGCCTDGFYFSDRDEVAKVQARMDQLTDEDWDQDLRKYVEKNGFVRVIKDDGDDETFKAKSKVYDKACVFQNRNGGSSGHTGCAFHWLGQRTGEDHVATMPDVCWQLPLRLTYNEDDTIVSLIPWDVAQWNVEAWEWEPRDFSARWWCVDTPEAYNGSQPVYKAMERELRAMLGDRPYDMMVQAIEERLGRGVTYGPMPGAIVNDGRPLLPLLIGNRTPRREPSYYPAFLANMKNNKDTDNGEERSG